MHANSVSGDGGPNRSTKSCRKVAGTVFEQSSEANEIDTKSIPIGSDPIHFDLGLGLRSKVGGNMAWSYASVEAQPWSYIASGGHGPGAMLPVEA